MANLRDFLFYEEPGITLYCGDCREVLPLLRCPNTSYCLEACDARCGPHVLVTDPPYGIAYNSGWSDEKRIRGDLDTSLRDCLLVEWGTKPALVFGGSLIPRPVTVREVLIWSKGEWPGMGDLAFPWGPSHEEIYVIGNGFVGPREGTVISVPRLTGLLRHPNEKPVQLLVRLIRKTVGTIVDPFAGSGTTLEAAKLLRRRAIGIEIEPKYCEIAVRRLRQEVLPL